MSRWSVHHGMVFTFSYFRKVKQQRGRGKQKSETDLKEDDFKGLSLLEECYYCLLQKSTNKFFLKISLFKRHFIQVLFSIKCFANVL